MITLPYSRQRSLWLHGLSLHLHPLLCICINDASTRGCGMHAGKGGGSPEAEAAGNQHTAQEACGLLWRLSACRHHELQQYILDQPWGVGAEPKAGSEEVHAPVNRLIMQTHCPEKRDTINTQGGIMLCAALHTTHF